MDMDASRASTMLEKYLISLFLIESGALDRSRSISLWMPIPAYNYNKLRAKTGIFISIHPPQSKQQQTTSPFISGIIQIVKRRSVGRLYFKMNQEKPIEVAVDEPKDEQEVVVEENESQEAVTLPLRCLKDHWLTISRPQYKRTCGISSLVSIWNYQFSRLGLGTRQPICIEQAMLKLNLIGKGSIEEGMRKKFKKTAELTEKTENGQPENPVNDDFSDKTLQEYIDSVDFGCFTGNDTLLKWYRLLCRIYGGCGRAYYFYKTNSERSTHKTQATARQALLEGLNKPNFSFIYHAYDHYFCPVGYQFIPKEESETDCFQSSQLGEEGSELYVMVGESSKMFPGIHVFKWSDIQLDLQTYWPKYFNIRRRGQGVQVRNGKENEPPATSTINCIMAFEKIRD